MGYNCRLFESLFDANKRDNRFIGWKIVFYYTTLYAEENILCNFIINDEYRMQLGRINSSKLDFVFHSPFTIFASKICDY